MDFQKKDIDKYNTAIAELIRNPVQSEDGTYHVKNGMIFCGYEFVPVQGFSESIHYWGIMH
jgi:hypothetical protein